MKIQLFQCVGVTPLLMDTQNPIVQDMHCASSNTPRPDKRPIREVAAQKIFYNKEGQISLPSSMLWESMRQARTKLLDWAGYQCCCQRGITPDMLHIKSEFLVLTSPDSKASPPWRPLLQRAKTNPLIRQKVFAVVRAGFDQWAFSVQIAYDPQVVDIEKVHKNIATAGKYVGLGSSTPLYGGRFGRFEILASSGVSTSAA